MKSHRKYIAILFLALSGFSILLISILLKGIIFNILVQVDNDLFTQFLLARERLREDTKNVYSDVVIIGIDDRALDKLGVYSPQKYRRYHVDVLANILKERPKAVVYDILFGDSHDDPEVDRKLSEVMKSGDVFSVCFGSDHDRSGAMFEPLGFDIPQNLKMTFESEKGFEPILPAIFNSLKGVGLANVYPDRDGMLRKVPVFFNVNDKLYSTIAFEVFRKINGTPHSEILIENGKITSGETKIPVDNYCRAYVNIDKKHRIREISFYDIWAGRVPARFFRDKVVFMAATATGLGDMKLVPLYGYVAGVRVHANLLLNLIHKNFIREVSGKHYYILIFFASLFYTYIFYMRHELSPFKMITNYISDIGIVTKAGEIILKVALINRFYGAIKKMGKKSYGLKIFFLVFSEIRQRLAPLLIHLVILYLALFLIFYQFNIFIKPSAVMIQLLISYIVVLEFQRIDFSEILPAGKRSK